MKKSLKVLIISLIALFSGCTKDTEMINDSVYAGANDEMVLRNAPPSECNNLLRNSDFENDLCDPGLIAFDGCVDDWDCYNGSADIVSGFWKWNDVPPPAYQYDNFWANVTFDNNWCFLGCGGSIGSPHSEGIYQSYNFNPNKRYDLSFDAATTEWFEFGDDNGNLKINVQIASNLATMCSISQGTTPACLSNFCYAESISNNSIYPVTERVEIDLGTGIYENELYIWVTTDNVTNYPAAFSTGALLDNLVMTCENLDISDVLSFDRGDFEYTFAVKLSGNASATSINSMDFLWDFGDGNTSTAKRPAHTYDTPGTYTVTLKVVDEEGCCAFFETEVVCQGASDCGYYLCWASGISEPVGIDFHADWFNDLVVVVNDSTVHMNDYEGSNPYNLPLALSTCWDNNPTCSVFDEISDWLINDLGYDGTIYSSYGGLGCNKGGEDVSEGLFLLNDGSVDIELVNINVTGPRNGEPDFQFEADFNSHCF